MTKSLCLLIALGACIDPTASSTDLAETAQDSTVVNGNCVASGSDNADLYVDDYPGAVETYTRTPPTSCSNISTQVGVSIGPFPIPPNTYSREYIEARVDAATWNLDSSFTTAQKKTECENSLLAMRVNDQNGNQLLYQEVHPSWTGSSCGEAAIDFTPPANKTWFIVRAKAIRGLEQYNHGYARTVIEAGHGALVGI
jgi:hypothetical protein